MSCAISQFFVLSPRGDVIIRRDFLGNVPRVSAEVFFRHCKFWKPGPGGLGEGEAPPIFTVDGVTYLHMKEGGVWLVATTRSNISPSLVLEFLRRVSIIIKDYCGMLSEDSVRKNFALIYELLDEILDYGVPQSTSTDALKTFVLNEPVIVTPPGAGKPLFSLSKGPTGVFKSVLDTSRTDGSKKDEIFVDVVERMTATFNASGHVASSQVDGAIQVRSYLTGNPPIKIRLNDDLIIGRRDNPYGSYSESSQSIYLDDANFHECANLDAFDTERTISLVPPDGEFALMNYRLTQGFQPPFRVYMTVDPDPISVDKATVTLKLWCEIQPSKAASSLEVEIPTPKYVERVHCDLDDSASRAPGTPSNQSWDYSEKGHLLKWKFKKVSGGQDFTMRARLTLERPYVPSLRAEIGPINLRFTIPMHNPSRLALRYLHILKKEKDYNPHRWVRYVTTSTSYTFRT